MRRAEGVIGAFAAFGEARKPALGPQGADAVTPPGQDLVGIALVAHVPDQLVTRGIEHRMNRHGQFNHAKTRAQMPPGFRHRADRLGPQLVSQLPQFAVRHAFHIVGNAHAVQHRGLGLVGLGKIGHGAPPRGIQLCREITKRAASIKAEARSP